MPFTPAGKTADLELATAEDLPKSRAVREISREGIRRADGSGGQLVTNEVTITVENTRSEPVPIDVKLDLLGKVDLAPDATLTTAESNGENPTTRASWHFTLPPGEKKEIKATYKKIV